MIFVLMIRHLVKGRVWNYWGPCRFGSGFQCWLYLRARFHWGLLFFGLSRLFEFCFFVEMWWEHLIISERREKLFFVWQSYSGLFYIVPKSVFGAKSYFFRGPLFIGFTCPCCHALFLRIYEILLQSFWRYLFCPKFEFFIIFERNVFWC